MNQNYNSTVVASGPASKDVINHKLFIGEPKQAVAWRMAGGSSGKILIRKENDLSLKSFALRGICNDFYTRLILRKHYLPL